MGKRTEFPQEDMEELYAKSNDTNLIVALMDVTTFSMLVVTHGMILPKIFLE
jgi:hypothetical protein